MSWQTYIDTSLVGTGCAKYGAICGLDGNIWAKSNDWAITEDQVNKIKANLGNSQKLAESGITLADIKYFFLSGDEELIRGKKGAGGIHIAKTNKALVLAAYEEPTQPGQCANIVEKLADYLKSQDY